MTEAELREIEQHYSKTIYIPPSVARRILGLEGKAFPTQSFQGWRKSHDIHPHHGWYSLAEILAALKTKRMESK